MKRRDLILIALGFVVLSGSRFADSAVNGFDAADGAKLDAAVLRLEQIPSHIGNWVSTDSELSEREKEVAGIAGYVRRTYVNSRTGYTVHLTVLCGPSGPISVHPPTACFEGIGYKVVSGPTAASLQQKESVRSAHFNRSSFRQTDSSVPETVRVFWSWGTAGEWNAPENPRFAFRGQSYLYKIYVTDRWLDESGRDPLPQIEAFMKDALPVISDVLQPPA